MKNLLRALAVVCFVLAVLYWMGSLQIGASHPGPHHTHAIVFAIVGVLVLVWVRFQSGAARR